MGATPLADLAQLGEQLEKTSRRSDLTALLAAFLRHLALEEVAPAVQLTIGQVFPEWDERALNVSWKAVLAVVDGLVDAPPSLRDEVWSQAVDGGEAVRMLFERSRRAPPTLPELTILEVYALLLEVAETVGKGSRSRKERLLADLYGRATGLEAKFLTKVILQEMRHGVNEGIMLEGIALAAGVRAALLRRAYQFWGDLGDIAQLAMSHGTAGLRDVSARLFHPLKPMLAQTAELMGEAFERYGGAVALEYKLDGARVQIHRQADRVHIYSRNQADVSTSLPDVVADVRATLLTPEAILDGEVIAVDASGRPLPFQHVMRRFRRKVGVARIADEVPVQLYLFDLLYADGRPLVDLPNQERWAALERAAGGLKLVRRLVPATIAEAQAFAEAARRDGHEGVMAKDLGSAYTPGVRGRTWLKLKHVLSLDLVIVAADWGYGRRHGWLSNYHLAALEPSSGQFLVVGKTFKGLTDNEFQDMTRRLLAEERWRQGGTVFVQPRLVAEVLFNEVQASSQYPSGLALRFARVLRLREDKNAHEADSIETVRKIYEQQFQFKGRPPGTAT